LTGDDRGGEPRHPFLSTGAEMYVDMLRDCACWCGYEAEHAGSML